MNASTLRVTRRPLRRSALALAGLIAALLAGAAPALAQAVDNTPSQRQLRTYIPQDQIVSFLPGTPFSEFVTLLNPTFQRVTGKMVVDPEGREEPIGVSIAGMHFIDAFELVLEMHRLGFRETDAYFIVEPLEDAAASAQVVGTDGASSQGEGGAVAPASALSREIRIDAHIFELNVTRVREAGTNWAAILGEQAGGGGGQGGGGENAEGLRLFLNTRPIFEPLEELIVGPAKTDISDVASLFRFFETQGFGETIASPSVTVQSGEQGKIQSGTDIPITVQDFAGNTITQYLPTGVIIEVTPTLVADASDLLEQGVAPGEDAPPVEFIHLDVRIEKSSARPSAAGVVVDKNQTDTQVLLLDGEQTVIGGLFSTEESIERRGVPILKDIPLLSYVFSYKRRDVVQKELLIVLESRMIEPLRVRSGQPLPQNLYERERRGLQRRLDRFKPGAGASFELIQPEDAD
ncbi:MAG: type II and III secretion system protein [Rhodothermales bacterium]|nr:type II and III secretion system protein [Rhodothermales bacterium]